VGLMVEKVAKQMVYIFSFRVNMKVPVQNAAKAQSGLEVYSSTLY
jgi:hypothetical protein